MHTWGSDRLSKLSSVLRLPGGKNSGRRGLRNLGGTSISLALLGIIALVTHQPFVFPSLGPTAFLICDVPDLPASWPRNAIFGHLVGAACGWTALALLGLLDSPTDVATGISANRAVAAALALGLTSGLMVWLRVTHPPACATTLIVSLGVLRSPAQLLVLMIAVAMLVAEGVVINRLAGFDYPLWDRPSPPRQDATSTAPDGGGSRRKGTSP